MSSSSSFLSGFEKNFPTPKHLDLNPSAIDLSDQSIRFMKLVRKSGHLVPEKFKEIQIDPKIIKMSEIDDSLEIDSEKIKPIVDALKSLKKEFSLNHVFVCLPEITSYIFKISIPREASGDIYSMIKFNIEENVPLKADGAEFDYHLIDFEKNSKKQNLMANVNVFPKKVIELYYAIFEMAGLTPISFESESVSLMRAIVEKGDPELYLSIRFLKDRMSACIIENGIVQYSTSIPVSALNIIEKEDSADSLELKTALNKLLVFWFSNKNYNREHRKIKTAILSGEEVLSPKIQEFLERCLRINIEMADPWKNCFDINKNVPEIHKKDALKFAPAIGTLTNKI